MTISSPGIGSNLDVNGIVSKLMSVESQPLTVLQTREASYLAKITAYGTIKGSLSSFQSAVSALSTAAKFQSFTTSSSDSSVLSASATSIASAGNYPVTVTTLAQSQSISSSGQTSTTAAVGAGTSTTLTFQFGTISGAAPVSGTYTGATFTQDATQATGTVTIDSSNNSLQGIRDAINSANIGVKASIINDGGATNSNHLVLTSTSTGASRSMKITSSGEDASVTSLLAYDPAATQNLTETSTAQNAALTVSGLAITSASNSVTGAIPGVTLNLTKGSGATTNVVVANDTASVISAVQSLVTSYNATNTTLKGLTSYDPTTQTAGLLLGDSSIQNIQAKMRSTISSSLSGLGGNTLTNLTQIGVTFLKDGSLSLDSTKLASATASNFSDFPALFAAFGKPTDSLVNYASSTANSTAGSYALSVTTLATKGGVVGSNKATQGLLTGSAPANLTVSAGTNDQMLVSVDGAASVAVTLTPGAPYASAAALATQVQTDINAALATAGQAGRVTVSQTGGVLKINSNSYGSASTVSIADDPGFPGNTGASSLLGTPTTSTITNITAGLNDKLTLSVDGISATVTLAAGSYTAAALATQIQSTVNASSAFTAAAKSISVTQNLDVLTLTSNSYGSSSAVAVTGGSASTNLFGATPASTAGTNVVGTINGVAATGSGQFLTGATGNAAEGIKVQVLGGVLGARGTINYSNGYAYNLNTMLNSFLSSTGPMASNTDSANRAITDLHTQADSLTLRLTATEKRYRAQFTALDTLIGSMSSTSSFLTQQLANLPKISG